MENEMKTYLKIKIKSLAAEARIIRDEERKWPGQHPLRASLRKHRLRDVRAEGRYALLAYGFLRHRPLAAVEGTARSEPCWERVQKLAEKYGGGDLSALRLRFEAWRAGGTLTSGQGGAVTLPAA
jgi:hypothetical protein